MNEFDSTADAERVLGGFMRLVAEHPAIRPKLVNAATSFRVTYTDPTCVVTMNGRQDPPVVTVGDAAIIQDVDVELSMSTRDGHVFWLGDLNVPMALAKKKVRVNGPVTKLLKLLPALQPAFGMYAGYLYELHASQESIPTAGQPNGLGQPDSQEG
ncbi:MULTISPECIES: hypothetical protein [unclassified Nocardioides]|uniref:hypothetical protein n=1 Tax=unclassified Nocardioides TaxID=2615069 RepID=UPI000A6DB697|nr:MULTISPECIES: hypothetical protein [unclassified Nocardioides]